MDFLNVKEVYFMGSSHKKVFYGGEVIWSKMKSEFSKDFRKLREDEEFSGIYDDNKKAFII